MIRLLILVLALVPGLAIAQEGETRVGFGLSTLGLKLEAARRIDARFGIRGAIAGLPGLSRDEAVDGIDYSLDGRIGGVAVLGDYYPTGGGLRLSGGLFLSTTDISATASDPNLEVGDSTYDASIEAGATFSRSVAPMLVVGYDREVASGWSIAAEVGAIAIGGIDVTLEETTPGGDIIPSADLDRERDQIAADADEIGLAPWLGLSLTYRF